VEVAFSIAVYEASYKGKAKSDLGPKEEGIRVSKGKFSMLRAMRASAGPSA
jgi:hypothetical protein